MADHPRLGLRAAVWLAVALGCLGFAMIDYVPAARPAAWVQPTAFYLGMAALAAALVEAIRGSFRRERPVDRGIAWTVALWSTLLLAWTLAVVLRIVQ